MIPTNRPATAPTPALALCVTALVLLGACQATPRSSASQAAVSACRTQVDRVYAAQNRGDLSRRSQTDAPFAGSSNVGRISDSLSAQYGRDQMNDSCLANAEAPAPEPEIKLPSAH